MSTEDMPTTNQAVGETMLAEKIPPALAAGFQKATSVIGNDTANVIKQTVRAGLSN